VNCHCLRIARDPLFYYTHNRTITRILRYNRYHIMLLPLLDSLGSGQLSSKGNQPKSSCCQSPVSLSPYHTTDPQPSFCAAEEQKIPAFIREQWKGTAVRSGPKFRLGSIATCYCCYLSILYLLLFCCAERRLRVGRLVCSLHTTGQLPGF